MPDSHNHKRYRAIAADATDTVRLAAWFAGIAFVLGFLLVVIFIPDADMRGLAVAAVMPIPMAAAAVASTLAVRKTSGKRARLWRLVGIATGSFFLGSLYRSYTVLTYGRFPAAGSFEDIAYVFGFLALVPVVLLLADPFEVVSERKVRGILDLATTLLITFSAALVLVFDPGRTLSTNAPLMQNLAFSIYPVAALSFVLYLITFKHSRWRSSDVLMLSSFITGTVGVGIAITRVGEYTPGSSIAAIVDPLLVTTFLLMALAATHALTQRETAAAEPLPEMDLPHWPGMVALLLSVVAIPLMIYVAAETTDPLLRGLLAVSTTLLGIAIVARSAVVTHENRKLAQRSIWDPLTGVFNHRHFRTRLAEESMLARRSNSTLCVCYLNVDHFDDFNQQWGHREGDLRLQRIAHVLCESSDIGGTAFRVGGDDFALMLPHSPIEQTVAECTRIALAVQTIHGSDAPAVTLSVGIAALPDHAQASDTLVRFAAGAAYWASQRGGDRIVVFDPEVVDALDSHEHVTKIERRSQTRLVETLAAAVDARDHYTRNHSANVADLARALAENLGFDAPRIAMLNAAALLHDVGKIGIPDAILTKTGSLTPSEYERIKSHPDLGARILAGTEESQIIPWVRHHHERWDGKGYPAGLSGEAIPLEARILTVCDAYDAMTSDRPYKRGRTVSDAIDEMHDCAGSQFDPDLVGPFVQTLIESWPETQIGDDATQVTMSDADEPARAIDPGA